MLQIKLWDRETCLKIGEYLDKYTDYDTDYSGDVWDSAYGLAPVSLYEEYDAPVFDKWLNVHEYGFNSCAKTGYFLVEQDWAIPFCFVKEMRQPKAKDV